MTIWKISEAHMSYSYKFSLLKHKRDMEFARDMQMHFHMPVLEVLSATAKIQPIDGESVFLKPIRKKFNRRPHVHTSS